jgi:hypothetical protein
MRPSRVREVRYGGRIRADGFRAKWGTQVSARLRRHLVEEVPQATDTEQINRPLGLEDVKFAGRTEEEM